MREGSTDLRMPSPRRTHWSCRRGRQGYWRRRCSMPRGVAGHTPLEASPLDAPHPCIAIVVPYRNQLPLQDRRKQLEEFSAHMAKFVAGMSHCEAMILIVEQSADGRRFNRGQLLNVGFHLAQQIWPRLSSFVTHDVDLLPSLSLRHAYAKPPPAGCAVHLASSWEKYQYDGFLGGVVAFRPEDFEKVNGYPNNYWGWGLEDDQLALRMAKCKVRKVSLRRELGAFVDLDPLNMKSLLEPGRIDDIKRHMDWYNAEMFRPGSFHVDEDWAQNGLSSLRYSVEAKTEQDLGGLVRHYIVRLLSSPSSA
eukprot:TRINITY_DN29568_c0_g3_i2.p1 TRINITY_DN29568_c0_g3~~TRINITY_DN29568_c0_g3_i2.p1  ORF type:complete len:307 (+),score=57.48 TRINITY_DN29568_c0_g3_i2:158-1078(+)